jgi:hypothetical protein
MKCTNCGKECYNEQYPEIVFKDKNNIICEECSIDYEQDNNGNIRKRSDL